MPKTFKILLNKVSLINNKDLRNIAQAAVKASSNEKTIKVVYPFHNGLQIDIEYNDAKNLFNFAMTFGILLNEVDKGRLLENTNFKECKFFCCANCLVVGKDKQDKLITNFCKKCAKKEVTKNEKTQRKNIKELAEKNKVKEVKEIEPIKEMPKQKIINPVKLKF